MNVARLFSYTRQLESQIRHEREERDFEVCALKAAGERDSRAFEKTLTELKASHVGERTALYEEIRSLRENNLGLLERVVIKLQMVPVSEPLKTEPLTEEQKAARSERVDSIRRTGPVAKSRQEAEAAYFERNEREEELRRKDATSRNPSMSLEEINAKTLAM